jgi:hypothetical protein
MLKCHFLPLLISITIFITCHAATSIDQPNYSILHANNQQSGTGLSTDAYAQHSVDYDVLPYYNLSLLSPHYPYGIATASSNGRGIVWFTRAPSGSKDKMCKMV